MKLLLVSLLLLAVVNLVSAGDIKDVHTKVNPRREQYIARLEAAKAVLNKHNITWSLWEGTLLGCIRNQKFMPWDSDTDLAIRSGPDWDKFSTPEVQADFVKVDHEIIKTWALWRVVAPGTTEENIEHHYEELGGPAYTDLNIIECGHDGLCTAPSAGGRPPFDQKILFADGLEPVPCKCEGLDLNCPNDPEALLKYLYGASWRIDDHKWDDGKQEWVEIDPEKEMAKQLESQDKEDSKRLKDYLKYQKMGLRSQGTDVLSES